MDPAQKQELAWIGDAVLALYARLWILEQKDIPAAQRSDVFIALTNNQFLLAIGDPTTVEAHIGSLYQSQGYPAASQYITDTLIPLYQKQRQNQKKSHPGHKKKKKG